MEYVCSECGAKYRVWQESCPKLFHDLNDSRLWTLVRDFRVENTFSHDGLEVLVQGIMEI